jgi:hypothetical protein
MVALWAEEGVPWGQEVLPAGHDVGEEEEISAGVQALIVHWNSKVQKWRGCVATTWTQDCNAAVSLEHYFCRLSSEDSLTEEKWTVRHCARLRLSYDLFLLNLRENIQFPSGGSSQVPDTTLEERTADMASAAACAFGYYLLGLLQGLGIKRHLIDTLR